MSISACSNNHDSDAVNKTNLLKIFQSTKKKQKTLPWEDLEANNQAISHGKTMVWLQET